MTGGAEAVRTVGMAGVRRRARRVTSTSASTNVCDPPLIYPSFSLKILSREFPTRLILVAIHAADILSENS